MIKKLVTIFFLVVLSSLTIQAQKQDVFDGRVDPEILQQFSKYDIVPVLVKLKDNSNIKYQSNDRENDRISKDFQRKDFFKNKTDNFLTGFSKEELRNTKVLLNGQNFFTNLTYEGLKNLARSNEDRKST